MGHSGRFRAASLGTEWQGYTLLAEVCEAAGLTRRQAHCVLLFGRGLTWAQMAPILRLSRCNARRYFMFAVRKIGRSRPHLYQERREWARMVLHCFRNVTSSREVGAPLYDITGRPAVTGSRVVSVEDLIGEEADFLALLVEDLKRGAPAGISAAARNPEVECARAA